ncbi:phenoloxidase-activating factor 2-like [Coccinella septempunctata]|uniref:phenoloxidase-activating factor 2-like n=1 Tax=Coccinella septempunctata TaxID=41139 RepID=UPI001D098699|nr:phenoloxidase-activating factor 2-like [Coccinella septempunctata]
MQYLYALFIILCCIFTVRCTSIIEKNDTALELLNNCKCVLKDYCYEGYVNIRGVGIITLRNELTNQSATEESEKIQCSNPTFICCKEWIDEFGNRAVSTHSSYQKEGKTGHLTSDKETFKVEKTKQKCGRPKPIINMRIYGSQDEISSAMDGEFPWMASIHRKNQLDGVFQFRCGGSLISDSVVLTAAHCVYSSRKTPSELRIIANAKKQIGKVGVDISEERDVKKVFVHPEYYSGGAHNDIALIFLEKSYNDSKDLNSICLPNRNSTYDKTRCIAAGWGVGNKRESNGENILSKVQLPIIDHESCQIQLRKTKLGEDFVLHESSICAGGEKGKDTCQGDGGGPLICPNEEGFFLQLGIVSWGVDCSKENQPGVYTNVEKFVDWIQNSIIVQK